MQCIGQSFFRCGAIAVLYSPELCRDSACAQYQCATAQKRDPGAAVKRPCCAGSCCHLRCSLPRLRHVRHACAHSCAAVQKLDPGAAVAVGAPLLVRMFVPLWVVNATSLPVAAWVVPIQAPPQPSERERGPSEGLVDPAESIRLQTLETESVQLPQSALRRCRIPQRFLLFDWYLSMSCRDMALHCAWPGHGSQHAPVSLQTLMDAQCMLSAAIGVLSVGLQIRLSLKLTDRERAISECMHGLCRGMPED
jgi:hypothetical protein